MDDIVKVYVGSAISVTLLKADLEDIGINPIVKNGRQSGVAAGFIGGTETSVELFISQSEVEKAKQLINDFKRRQEENNN